MSEHSPRILFVPVSGKFGAGEYSRCLAISEGVVQRWPKAALLFILSRQAPYAARAPVPTELLESSPTFHTPAVIEIIHRWRPQVVVFDNSGRSAQLRAAKRAGAHVVYISSRRRLRNKAYRLRWMRMLDEHWIAYPSFVAGGPTSMERLKLRFMRRPAIRYLDVVLASATPVQRSLQQAAIDGFELRLREYVVVVPGGGTGHPGAHNAVEQFLRTARELAESGTDTVFVGAVAASAPRSLRLHLAGQLPQSVLGELLRGAMLVIVNGGSTLLQAIACGRPCVAAPIAHDQVERIDRCVRAGVAIAAPLDAQVMSRIALGLLDDPTRAAALAGRACALGLGNGVEIAVSALAAMLDVQ